MSVLLEDFADSVLTLTLNMPEKRNPISNPEMIAALCDVIARADRDTEVRAVILTGAGSAFSSGGDLRAMKAGGGLRDEAPVKTRRNYIDGIQRLPRVFQSIEVPVIAAVNGPAIGAGCDLACMCDIRIASQSAKFAESFVKVGLVPGDGGAWLLPKVIGISRATELALTGRVIPAEEALQIGLVSRVVPDDDLSRAARGIAQEIAANPPYAVRVTKRLLRNAYQAELTEVLEMSAAMQALMHETKDHAEAIAAFLEKRKPRFTGE